MVATNICKDSSQSKDLKIVSFNMRGFNQGYSAIQEMINTIDPDVFLCQEHWLTPANLHKFHDHFSNFFMFGSSPQRCQIRLRLVSLEDALLVV